MPVKIPNALPAAYTLSAENIFVMDENRAASQDIRPLRIAILNLMPTKEATETQLLRLLGNSPLQVEPVLLTTKSYISTHTSLEYLDTFYRNFDDCRDEKFDGFIITGAPVEKMPFEEVKYWDELKEIMAWADKNVFSTFYICWAAQAGLYYHYGIPKYDLTQKMFGVYEHSVLKKGVKLMRGFDDAFYAPHSRHTEVRRSDIEKHEQLEILAESELAGVYIVSSTDSRQIYVTGHSEYDSTTLENEYKRDIGRGLEIAPPLNYYPNDDPSRSPRVTWRAHANLLFANWLNYCVYQETPYDIDAI